MSRKSPQKRFSKDAIPRIQTKLDSFFTATRKLTKTDVKENMKDLTTTKQKDVKKTRNICKTREVLASSQFEKAEDLAIHNFSLIDSNPENCRLDLSDICGTQTSSSCPSQLNLISVTKGKTLSTKREKLKPRILQRELSQQTIVKSDEIVLSKDSHEESLFEQSKPNPSSYMSELNGENSIFQNSRIDDIEHLINNFDSNKSPDSTEIGNIFNQLETLEYSLNPVKMEEEKTEEKIVCKRSLEDSEVSPNKKIDSNPNSPELNSPKPIAYTLRVCNNLFYEQPIQLQEYGVANVIVNLTSKYDFMARINSIDNVNSFMKHFYTILRFIFQHPNLDSALYPEEKMILYEFLMLPHIYQLVCLKLFLYLPKWYNIAKYMDKINVQLDTKDIIAMVQTLSEKKFTDSDYLQETPSFLLNLLTIGQIKDICKKFHLKFNKKKSSKEQLICMIIMHCNNQTTLSGKGSDCILMDRITEKLGSCFKLNLEFHHILYRVHLLYSFTNADIHHPRDLYYLMDRIDSGEFVMPSYTIDSFEVIFKTQSEFKRFTLARELYDEFVIATEKKSKEILIDLTNKAIEIFKVLIKEEIPDNMELDSYRKRFSPGNIYAKILSKACEHFAKNFKFVMQILELLLSQNIYGRSNRADWLNRSALISENYLKDTEKAAQTIIEALCSTLITTPELYEISERGKRLIRRNSNRPTTETVARLKYLLKDFDTTSDVRTVDIRGNSLPIKRPGMKTVYLEEGYLWGVESVALNFYQENGYPSGVHCEGRLMTIFYFLFFWDIIFEYHSGLFISEIQYTPLDFFSKDFYVVRKEKIDCRLKEIQSDWSIEQLNAKFLTTYQNENNKIYLGSKELLADVDMLIEILNCLDRVVLRDILYKFAVNYRHFSSGFPDLFIWNNKLRKCKFVEVKGGKDKLSVKQKLWLKYLREIEADVEVCHVNAPKKRFISAQTNS